MNYIYYTHVDPEVKTVEEFLTQFGLSIARGISKSDFLQYSDEFGLTNLERIYSTYDKYEKIDNQAKYEIQDVTLLKPFTVIVLPKDKIQKEVLAITGANQIDGSLKYTGFLANALRDLLTSESATRKYTNGDSNAGITQVDHSDVSVWIWVRALNQIIDVTPHITRVTTNIDQNGGNFSFTLGAVEQDFVDGKFVLKSVKGSRYNHVAVSHDLSQNVASKQFFHNVLCQNDLVLIRFEQLKAERDRVVQNFEVDPSEIPSTVANPKIYDMIGLLDSSPITYSGANSDWEVTVQGKDLSKVLIDDASYFYPLAFAQNVFTNTQQESKLIKRLAVDGQFILQAKMAYRSIRYTVQYIINHLANIQVVPDELLSFYGGRRTLVYRLDTNIQSENNSENLKNEIKKTVSVFTTSFNPQITADQINSANNDALSFIEAAIQAKALTKTDGVYSGYTQFTWQGTIVQPFKTPQQLSSKGLFLWKTVATSENTTTTSPSLLLKAMLEYASTQLVQSEQISETPARGIWQIIKLVFDESVSDRRVADPSISQPDGSLMAQMRKIAQDPFIEFSSDTYGDLFYFIFRQPPFTGEALQQYKRATIVSEQENSEHIVLPGGKTNSVIIDIEDYEVDSFDFDFDPTSYSMYQIEPQGLFLGQGSSVSLAYIPIVFLPQYADIWGAKRMSTVSNYIPYSGISGKQAAEGKNYLIEQATDDLCFMIDCNSYLPFTRKGSISLYGNRTIKRGTWIRFKATKELFYVRGVYHSHSINEGRVSRSTRLTVDRGMVEEYTDLNAEINYFNIVDTKTIKEYIKAYLLGNKEKESQLGVQLSQSFGVNQNSFDFFIKRLQKK